MKKILEIKNLNKSYDEIKVLTDFNMTLYEHEFVVVKGKSGAGKSTLLNIIGLLESKDSGNISIFDKENVIPFSKNAQKLLKNKVGYIFQNFALVDDETVYYNLNLAISGKALKNKKNIISQALCKVGLKGYEDKKVYKCSGGEQQRIAIARLLIKSCELILADEPTGSLDEGNRDIILKLLLKLKKDGKSLIVVTHDDTLMKIADRVIEL